MKLITLNTHSIVEPDYEEKLYSFSRVVLEERPEITAYEACKPLDINRLDALQKTDIRGEYFREQWSSDFYIRHADGTAAVRELVSAADMTKRAEVEKLELSRRYWAALGVNDWMVVITG